MLPSDWIPEPTVILVGCQAWPPKIDRDKACPVCDRGINPADPTYYCAACDSLSPQREARVRAARLGLKARDRSAAAEKRGRDRLKNHPVELTESERRRLWNGYRGSILAETDEVTNIAKVGREWLTSIAQTPDWSIVLDRRGNMIGRLHDGDEPS